MNFFIKQRIYPDNRQLITMISNERLTNLRNWGKLGLGLLVIFVFVFWVAPALERLPYIAEVHDYVYEHDIDATALVYSEIEEFGDADVSIRDAMKY